MNITLQRAYDRPARTEGYRILVDRMWPRGVRRETLQVDDWLQDIAPSTALRKWFDHDPKKWGEFKRRYFCELDAQAKTVATLIERAREQELILVFSARNLQFNNASALREYLARRLEKNDAMSAS